MALAREKRYTPRVPRATRPEFRGPQSRPPSAQLSAEERPSLCTPCVVRSAARALVPQHVEGDGGSLLAVVAYDPDLHVLVLRRHGGLGDLAVHLHPELLE